MAVLHAVAVCAQPVLAGVYLNGDGAAARIHGPVGLTAAALCLVQLVLTWFTSRLSAPFVLTAAVLAGEALMIHSGFGRELALHIPLGLAVVAGSVALAVRTLRTAVPA
ncbi:hypothetical protein GCM10009741_65520 [Kribbella lupini]|uniref:Uncharacterized protein n=1 Tax=Kribbella lupini TaxID=291602 RepID=A0ABP4MXI0_9ACTN